MKKLQVIIAFCVVSIGACPVFAQKGKILQAGLNAAEHAPQNITQNIGRELQRTTLQSARSNAPQMARIINLPDMPQVQVRLDDSYPAGSEVEARLLFRNELYRNVGLAESLHEHMPVAFTYPKKEVFRGVKLAKLGELENLLRNGMELDKSHYKGSIYCGYAPTTALDYALPTEESFIYENWAEPDMTFPVIMQIPLTEQLLQENPLDPLEDWAVFHKTIPADRISNIVVFLEINGKQDWYKAGLENNRLLLTPAPPAATKGYVELWAD